MCVEDTMTHLHDTEKSRDLERVHLGKYRKGQCNCSIFQEKGTLQMCPKCILTEQALIGEEDMGGSDVDMDQEGSGR